MEENKEKTNKNGIKIKGFWHRLWKLLAPSQKQMKNLFALVVVFEAMRMVGPYLLKLVIDAITEFNRENIDEILILLLLMFLAEQIVGVLDFVLDKKRIDLLSEIETYLPAKAHQKMLELSLGYHEKENTGKKITKIQRGVDKISELLGNTFWDVGPTIIQIVITTIVLLIVDYRFGLIFLLFVPIFVIITIKANRRVFDYRKQRHDDYEEASGLMAQSIININTVKSFVQEKREEKQYVKIQDRIKKNIKREFGILLRFNWSRGFIIDVGRVGVLLFGVYLAWMGSITIGSLVFVFTITEKALLSLWRISRLYDKVMESSEAIDRLYFLEKEKPSIANANKGIKPSKVIGQIKFENVNFSYDQSRLKALNNVNMKINSGCMTALVGPSGGGKTTVAKMIYRHYDPQSGKVLIDDINLKKYDLYAIREHIAIVPQEVEIFNTSVKDNIAYADPRATQKEIEAAARIANAEEFINDLPEKYNTLVGERGIKLSGGQRQRVGIARAILANPKILIFDEATSSLDSYSERLIQDAIDKISKGRTMIVIAHRLSTIKKADKIIVLENGKVVEEGNHIELSSKKGGIYSKLLNLQKMGDID